MIRVLYLCLALLALASPARAATVIACQDVNGSDFPASVANPCPVTIVGGTAQTSQYPTGAVPVQASATGTTAATTATLAAASSAKTYICGFSIRANATAAATADSTVTGPTTTMHFSQWTAPLASGIGLTEMIFTPCIPSSAINTGISAISAAPGSGGVVSVTAWGYQL